MDASYDLFYDATIQQVSIADLNRILLNPPRVIFTSQNLVQARNLHEEDLVFGGIIGNANTTYMISPKADGLRTLLVIHSTGLWFIYPPHSFNLIGVLIPGLRDYVGTIIDGELITIADKIPDPSSTTPKYLFIAFDILAFKGSNDIQKRHYAERRLCIQQFVEAYPSQNLFQVLVKEAHEINTIDQFYAYSYDLLTRMASGMIEYKTDGLIFIPTCCYNPRSNRHTLSQRVLTEYADVCKWKPPENITIDFSLRMDPMTKAMILQTQRYNPVTKQQDYLDFKIGKASATVPPAENQAFADIHNLNPKWVGEFAWNGKFFQLVKERPDKLSPNDTDIAYDNWKLIRKPLKPNTIMGLDLKPMRRYHNFLKRKLYELIPDRGTLLDIGSGLGGDLDKWYRRGLRKIIAVEPNAKMREGFVGPDGEKQEGFNQRLKAMVDQGKLRNDQVVLLPVHGEDSDAIIRAVKQQLPEGKVDAVSLMFSRPSSGRTLLLWTH